MNELEEYNQTEEQVQYEPVTSPQPPKKRKRHPFLGGLTLGFVIGVIALLVVARVVSNASKPDTSHNSNAGEVPENISSYLDEEARAKLDIIAAYIGNYYYEDVTEEDIQNGIYAGMFNSLDDYSQYYTAEEYKELYDETITGTYCGIGATLQQDKETKEKVIVKITPGSPAEEAGLMAEDIIVKADEFNGADMELTEFVSHIRGEEGTTVHLQVWREGEKEYLEFDIERRPLSFPMVDYKMLENNIGYLQLSEFSNSAVTQFQDALADLKSQGTTSLILDLRSNPGGLLNAAVSIADEILPEGLVVYTEDKYGTVKEYNSTDGAELDMPIVVLVNEYSASASEIVSGALKDRGAATIVGTKTFGKGIVQSIIDLYDGSAIKLTTSRYFTPSGVCIHEVGIEPDVEIEYEFLGGEEDSYSVELDNQIMKAVEMLME